MEALTTYVEGHSADLEAEDSTDDAAIDRTSRSDAVDDAPSADLTAEPAAAENAASSLGDEGVRDAASERQAPPEHSFAAAEDAMSSGEEGDPDRSDTDSDERLSRVETG